MRAIAGSSGQTFAIGAEGRFPPPEDRRGLTRRDHRRVQEQVVADLDGHAVGPELDPQRAPQRLDPRLRRPVGAEAGRREEGRGRGDQQEVAARREHMRQRRPDRTPDAEQVDVERVLDRLRPRPAAAARRTPCPRSRRQVEPAAARPAASMAADSAARVTHVGDRGPAPRERRSASSRSPSRSISAEPHARGPRAAGRARRRCPTRRR